MEQQEDRWSNILRNWHALERAKPGYIAYCLQEEGIPDFYRGQVWIALTAQAQPLHAKNPAVYKQLGRVEKVPQEGAISRDIKRTFSKHQFFANNLGQLELFQVLRAYAAYDPECGYCQGMGFLVATMLCYMPAESAFWLLVALLQRPEYDMRQLFRPGMPKFRPAMQKFSTLLSIVAPRIHHHFQLLGIEPGMYASQWFMTIFAYNFCLEFVVRVWDLFLAEGWSVVYKVGLQLLLNDQDVLVSLDFEKVMVHLGEIPKRVSVNDVFPAAMHLKLSPDLKRFMSLS